jgi:hypothetical protein
MACYSNNFYWDCFDPVRPQESTYDERDMKFRNNTAHFSPLILPSSTNIDIFDKIENS